MIDTVTAAESSINYWNRFRQRHVLTGIQGVNDAITHSCCLHPPWTWRPPPSWLPTQSGHTARVISRYRPACPILAMCQSERTRRQLAISWGVHTCLTGNVDSTDRLFSMSVEMAVKEGAVKEGDTVVITAGVPIGEERLHQPHQGPGHLSK